VRGICCGGVKSPGDDGERGGVFGVMGGGGCHGCGCGCGCSGG
jgi:hypothetical protein